MIWNAWVKWEGWVRSAIFVFDGHVFSFLVAAEGLIPRHHGSFLAWGNCGVHGGSGEVLMGLELLGGFTCDFVDSLGFR